MSRSLLDAEVMGEAGQQRISHLLAVLKPFVRSSTSTGLGSKSYMYLLIPTFTSDHVAQLCRYA